MYTPKNTFQLVGLSNNSVHVQLHVCISTAVHLLGIIIIIIFCTMLPYFVLPVIQVYMYLYVSAKTPFVILES